jgi:hypothetical protein
MSYLINHILLKEVPTMEKFINLTPHCITIFTDEGTKEIWPNGQVARIDQKTVVIGRVNGVDVVRAQYGDVVNLPEPEPNMLLIVSAMVRVALPGRRDLLSPGDMVRDEAGKVIGCKNLISN